MEGAEKLCRTGWVEFSDGRCGEGVQSKNKGLECQANSDCPTSRTGINTTCRCGFNANGTKYCDVEGGDDEWVAARSAFQLYIDGTKNCHNAARWTECGNQELYKEWRCAEFAALYYVELLDNPTCLSEMYDSLPGFREMVMYCKGYWLSFGILQLLAIALILFIALI